MKELIRNFQEAIADEIEAVRKASLQGATQLSQGILQEQTSQGNIYMFPIKGEFSIQDDTPILLSVNGDRSEGLVVACGGGRISLCVQGYFGPAIARASFTKDETDLLARLSARLRDVAAGSSEVTDFNVDMVKRVLGMKSPRCGGVSPRTRLEDSLNESQQSAVRKALGSQVSYLWGPPGTGKSHALARIVHEHYLRDRTIHILCNTHQAVDSLVRAVCRVLHAADDRGFLNGAVIRKGAIVDSELREQFAEYIDLDKIVARLSSELQKRRETLRARAEGYEAKIASFEEELAKLALKKELTGKEAVASKSVKKAKAVLGDRERARLSLEKKIGDLDLQIADAEARSAVVRFFRGVRLEELRERRGLVQRDLGVLSAQESTARKHLAKAIAGHGAIQTRLRAVSGEVVGRSAGDFRRQIALQQQNLENANTEISDLAGRLAKVREDVAGNRRVTAATATRAYFTAGEFQVADVVVVDEASMLVLPSVAYLAGLAAHHVVIGGDFRQLPPIVRSRTAAANEWMATDVFQKAGIVDAVNNRESPDALLKLDTQYRMDAKICELINGPFYGGGGLRTGVGAGSAKRPEDYPPLLRDNLVLIDTSSQNPYAHRGPEGKSRFNLVHAVVLRNVLAHLRQYGIPEGPKDVGIITPCRPQADLLGEMCAEMRWEEINAGTVHKFQGDEKDIIFFDVTDSTGMSPTPFNDASSLEQQGAKLLNVALSRARSRMVFIANMAYVGERLSPYSYLRQSLEYVRKHGTVVDAAEFLDVPGDVPDYSEIGTLPEDSLSRLYSELDYEEALVRDVERAQESVVIFSGFSTHRRVNKWKDLLLSKVAQGVRVRCVTRDPDNQPSIDVDSTKRALMHLIEGAVTLDLRHEIHEKAVMIDGRVLWYGSLNPLSHSGRTDESLLRLASRRVCVAFASSEIYERRRIPRGRPQEVEQSVLKLFAERENPICGGCGSYTVLHTKGGRNGPFYTCAVDGCRWTGELGQPPAGTGNVVGVTPLSATQPPTGAGQSSNGAKAGTLDAPQPGAPGEVPKSRNDEGHEPRAAWPGTGPVLGANQGSAPKSVAIPSAIGSNRNLRSRLKEWRDSVAGIKGVQKYMVLSNTALEHIVALRPANGQELLTASGVGPVKVEQFGADILEIINEGCSLDGSQVDVGGVIDAVVAGFQMPPGYRQEMNLKGCLPSRAYAAWLAEEDQLLKNLNAEGKRPAQIARLLLRGCGSVESRLRKLGL